MKITFAGLFQSRYPSKNTLDLNFIAPHHSRKKYSPALSPASAQMQDTFIPRVSYQSIQTRDGNLTSLLTVKKEKQLAFFRLSLKS